MTKTQMLVNLASDLGAFGQVEYTGGWFVLSDVCGTVRLGRSFDTAEKALRETYERAESTDADTTAADTTAADTTAADTTAADTTAADTTAADTTAADTTAADTTAADTTAADTTAADTTAAELAVTEPRIIPVFVFPAGPTPSYLAKQRAKRRDKARRAQKVARRNNRG